MHNRFAAQHAAIGAAAIPVPTPTLALRSYLRPACASMQGVQPAFQSESIHGSHGHQRHHRCPARLTSGWRFDGSLQLSAASASEAHSASNVFAQPTAFASAFWRFCRPHTMYGTAIAVASISLLAVQSQPAVAWGVAVTGLAQALISALLMNIAIVGINQLSDVDIDKVNKPYLPLASGEFSMQTGVLITAGTALAGLCIGCLSNSLPLLATLVVSLLLGILYSIELPFMRWKRSPVLAAGCILAVRALAVQLGFFFHMQHALSAAPAAAAVVGAWQPSSLVTLSSGLQLTPAILFTVCFMLLFSVVIALFKDIPDVLGDRGANVQTLTVRLGVHRVFWACIWILTTAYAGAVTYSVLAAHFWSAAPAAAVPLIAAGGGSATGLGAMMPASLSLIGGSGGNLGLRVLMCVAGHCVLAGLLWQRALKTDLNSNKDISDCYMHVWKLFYSEYVLIPLLL